MRDDLPAGHIGLLFTDIEGSTRLLHRLGAAGYAQAQADHRDLLREAFRSNGGVEVDTQGDGFFYVFPDALSCLRGAVAGHRALAGFDWAHGQPVKVRMGMHAGEPQKTDEGYVGVPVNLAARISSAGCGGQVLISAEAAEEIQAKLTDDDISLRDLGNHRLKDMEAEERLLQAVIPELPSDFPPPRTAATRPNNLPVALTPFIGRAQLISDVRDLMLQPQTRAITLLGPGGTGKTRLGLRVATELLHSLEDGAFFVPLAPIRDAEQVPGAVAAALELREEPGEPLRQTIISHLEDKELLLLLDNFEQVQPAAQFVAELLRSCPGTKILTTSRQPLRISGERGVRVPPLELPSEDARLSLDEVAKYEAVRLFVDRAQSAQWDFELTEDNVTDVVEICRRIDSLPLAIELATARLFEMTVSEVRAAISERMRVLTDGAVDLLDHQKTLRDLIAWSYEMLDPELQTTWRRLAVFEGGWTVKAAEAVCDLEDQGTMQKSIDELVQRSLATIATEASSTADKVLRTGAISRRYTMLETLHEFAADSLAGTPEVESVRARHRDWFLALAENSKPKLRGPESVRWLAELNPDTANFRAVMQRCTSSTSPDPENALRLGAALWIFWYTLGYMTEGREHLRLAIDIGQDLQSESMAAALLAEATISRQQNKIDEALEYGERSLALYRKLDDPMGVPAAISELAAIVMRQKDYDRAEAFLTESIALLRAQGSRERLAFSLNLLGMVEQLRDQPDDARGHYEESLTLGREIGDQNVIGTALVNLGEIAQIQGDIEAATDWFRQSLTVWLDLGQDLATVYCLEMLAGIDAAAGRGEEATTLFATASRLREEQDIPVESYNLGRYESDLELARNLLGQEQFDAVWSKGHTMPMQEVAELAMVDEEAGG